MENGHVTKAGKRADVHVLANVTIMPSTTAVLICRFLFLKFLFKISKRRIKFMFIYSTYNNSFQKQQVLQTCTRVEQSKALKVSDDVLAGSFRVKISSCQDA